MHIAFIVFSVLLAVEMAVTGAPKALQLSFVRASSEHLGVSVALERMIGLAQVGAAVGLLLGIAIPALSVVTGAAVCLLMAGAIGYHVRARDNVLAMAPAVLTAALAIAVVVLAAGPPTPLSLNL
ncbi:DoxX family protein [Mycobacterium sp. 3519A]|uniref:DoxX family protein n=1 Tax=Mycobacterium sp. 3519A TaxID=2057184 RepID=UPI000C7DAAC6|nr:DoxX family protein [Mycobacterium sp. 3519A]